MAEPIEPSKADEALKILIERLEKTNPTLAELIKQSSLLSTTIERQKKTTEQYVRAIEQTTEDFDELSESYKKGKKTYAQTVQDLGRISNAIDEVDVSTLKTAQQIEAYENLMAKRTAMGKELMGEALKKGMIQSVGTGVAAVFTFMKAQLMTGIRGLQGDASATQVAADLMTAGIDSAAAGVSNVAGVAKGVGSALMAIPHPAAQVAGALTGLVADVVNAGAKQAAEIAKFAVEVVSKELEKTVKSFNQASAAGAVFANGLTGLRESAKAAGLTQDQYSKIIANNAEAMANFGGSVTDGAKKLGSVTSKFGEGTQKTLLKLGVSIEDQAEGTANYLSMLQQTGNLRGKSDEQLARESANYLVNLKAISAFTGEDAKAAQKRAKDAAMQGAVRAKLDDLGGSATEKFQNSIATMPASLQKAAQQMLAYGEVTDAELAASLAQMPGAMELLKKTVGDVSSSTVSANDALDNFQRNAKDLAPTMKAESKAVMQVAGTAALAGTSGIVGSMSNIAGDLSTLATKAGSAGEKTTREAAQAAANTQDGLTNSVADSSVALQNMKVEIQDRLTPAIRDFAAMVPNILRTLQAQIDLVSGNIQSQKDDASKASAKAERDAAFANATFMQKYFQIGMTDAQKEAQAKYNAATQVGPGNEFDLPQYALGGITQGLSLAGEAGPEAVVPLPDGRTIPVKIDAGSMLGGMQNPLEKLAEGISSLFGKGTNAGAGTTVTSQSGADMSTLLMQFNQSTQEQLENQRRMIGILEDNVTATERLLNAVS